MSGPFVHHIDPIIGSLAGVHVWWYGFDPEQLDAGRTGTIRRAARGPDAFMALPAPRHRPAMNDATKYNRRWP